MIQKTRAIVLNSIKYSDSSMIVKMYSEHFGILSVMVRFGRGKKARLKSNIFQPLFLLFLNIDYKRNKELQHCKEIALETLTPEIAFDTIKSSIAIFLAEILSKLLREEEANGELFDFLHNSIQLLNETKEGVANFHLLFLYKLSKYLGVYPMDNYSEDFLYFDLSKGCYSRENKYSQTIVNKIISRQIHTIANCSFLDLNSLKISGKLRSQILNTLIFYYKYHFPEVGNIKSLDILTQIFY